MPPTLRKPATRPVRVGVVCAQLEIGGQESGMLEVLRRLDRKQFVPFVYAFRNGPLLRPIRRLGVPVVVGSDRVGPQRAWTRADRRAKTAFRRRLAEAFRADRIDVCLVYAWADAVSAAREAGVPALVERVDGPKLIGWVRDKSSCQHIICESESIRRLLDAQRELLRCEAVPITVIQNGIDLERFDPDRYGRARSRRALGLEAGDFVVGTVARLAPVKNLGHVLEAARSLLRQTGTTAHVRVLIAGPDGGSGTALRAQARELGIARHVRFLGARDDVPGILRALDVFVLTSIQEGMPFALLEAMAMGLPVVATQADSIAESIRDNAFLVGPLDPLRTTLALRDLLRHEGLRRAMGRRSRRLALRHGVDAMVRRYEEVLRAAFRAGGKQSLFRRRVVVMPGHARSRRAPRATDTLFEGLRANDVDVYKLGMSAARTAPVLKWPPRRRQWFAATVEGWMARRTCLDWIQPDVLVTDCPRIVVHARQSLPGEEIVFMPDPDDPCDAAKAGRIADRILVERVDEARRWQRWAWKVSRIPAREADRARHVLSILASPQPIVPRSKR